MSGDLVEWATGFAIFLPVSVLAVSTMGPSEPRRERLREHRIPRLDLDRAAEIRDGQR